MKNLLAFVLLLLVLSPFQVIFTKYQMERYAIRKEVKKDFLNKLDPSQLVRLVFSKEETAELLEWEHEDEFEYLGEMYDVVSREVRGDSISYLCFPDKKESSLNKKLEALLKNEKNKRDENKCSTSCDFLFKIALFDDSNETPSSFRYDVESLSYHYQLFTSWTSSPPSPPPQRV